MAEWIPINADDPRSFPKNDDYILLSFSNMGTPIVGRFEEDDDDGGAFYIGDDMDSAATIGLFVNAWMPLPKCYRED
jgi:hypothetical protein